MPKHPKKAKPVKKAKPAKKAPKKSKSAKLAKKAPKKSKSAKLAKDLNKKAKDMASLRELVPVAKEINVRLEKASQADGKAFDHRLAAAIQMEGARKICDKRKLSFKKWAEENFALAYETVKKLTQVGAADDPKLALEDMRLKNKAANKVMRARKAAEPKASRDPSQGGHRDAPAATDSPRTPFNVANDAVAALDDKTQLSLIESRAGDLGMSVVAKGNLESLKKAEAGTKETGVEGVKFYFNNLKPSDKMPFLEWAAAEVGVKLNNPMSNDAATVEELTDIPAHMRRGKKGSAGGST